MDWLRSIVPVLMVVGAQPSLWAQQTETAAAKKLPSHPAEVALVDEGQRGSVYRRFPSGQRLYVFDLDPRGRSTCNGGCALAWPPVPAPDDAVTIGDWTIIKRTDGTQQWALKGKPVYTRFHDSPEAPGGESAGSAWHLVPYTSVPANPAVVAAKR